MKQGNRAVKLLWYILQSNSLETREVKMYPFVFNSSQWILCPIIL